ncbi:MAG: hypothetical protein GY914_04225 [Prochlorococcus sp.]|nr:hypothetical protein [Prochlorococcus sp.]
MATASEKREDVKSKLQVLRKDLRVMHAGVIEETVLPDPADVRAAMTQLEALLALLEKKSSRKPKAAK